MWWWLSFSHVWLSVTPWTAACQPPCPSLSPRVCSNSCRLSWWCHPTISSSVTSFSSCPQSFLASESFPIESALRITKVWNFIISPSNEYSGPISFDWLGWSPCCLRDCQESSPIPQFKSMIRWCSCFFMVQVSHPYMTTGKIRALTRWTFVGKALSLLFSSVFERTLLFSRVAMPIYISINSAQAFPFLYILTNACYLLSSWW